MRSNPHFYCAVLFLASRENCAKIYIRGRRSAVESKFYVRGNLQNYFNSRKTYSCTNKNCKKLCFNDKIHSEFTEYNEQKKICKLFGQNYAKGALMIFFYCLIRTLLLFILSVPIYK